MKQDKIEKHSQTQSLILHLSLTGWSVYSM